jgi:hypothetical protein
VWSRIGTGIDVAKFVLQPLTIDRAKVHIGRRMAARNDFFLRMMRAAIWPYPDSPYHRLLTWAKWTPERVEDGVRRNGIERTLQSMLDGGVYVTFDEFKGRVPIDRGGLAFQVTEDDFNNPSVIPTFEVRTSGTRSRGSSVPATLEYIADQRAPVWRITLEVLGAGRSPVVIWLHSRTASGRAWWLALAHMGRPPLRWFSIVDTKSGTASGHEAMFGLLQSMAKLKGMQLPPVEIASFEDVSVVLDAVLDARRRHGSCMVVTTPSAATRMALEAEKRGTDLKDVTLLVGAEPLTPGKNADIVRMRGRVGVRYNFTEAGAVGCPCGAPATFDDVHLMADAFALVRRPREFNGGAEDAFVFTSLLPTSPKLLFNAESDDFGDVTERSCGCIWDQLGMRVHLANIRSFSKLTGEGLTLLGTDVVHVIEEVLPREYGGRSIDYQLVEVEDAQRITRLHLIVSPSVGPVDDARVIKTFIEGLRAPGHPRSFFLPPLWEQAGTIQVVRREPVVTAGGKLLPFHTQASPALRQPPAVETIVGKA